MRLLSTLVIVSATLAGCDGDVTYSGISVYNYLPFDGERTWEFINTDVSIEHKLVATLDSEFTNNGESHVYSVRYDLVCVNPDGGCVDGYLRTIDWSSDLTYGVRIWGMADNAGATTFDPPILFSEGQMLVEESVTTDTGGVSWTSTLIGKDTCPVLWTQEWEDDCLRITLDDGGAQHPLAGDYWIITQYNLVAFQLTDDTGQWQLSYATYEYN